LIINTWSRTHAICSEVLESNKKSKKEKKKDKKKKKRRNRSPIVSFLITRALTPAMKNVKQLVKDSILAIRREEKRLLKE
jgi:hypothetical protein